MKNQKFKTNINCAGCLAKVKPYMEGNTSIAHWEVDTHNPDKILTVTGNVEVAQVSSLVENAGFFAVPLADNAIQGFWEDAQVWKRAAQNTLNCLIGCSIGDFGTIMYLQFFYPDLPVWLTMSLAMAMGLLSSIALETFLLYRQEHLSIKQAFQTALGMSLISMLAMELAMNVVDFMITGGKANFHHHTYWLAFGAALVAGFLAPLPYNYFKLKKYNKACH